jgi:hypothetical protein
MDSGVTVSGNRVIRKKIAFSHMGISFHSL